MSNGNVAIRGLAVGSITIDATADELLVVVQTERLPTRLSLLDSQGHLLVESEDGSADDPESVIDEDLTAGSYTLGVNSSGGLGTDTLTTMLTPSTFQSQAPITNATGSDPDSIVAGDFNGDGRLDLAIANGESNTVSVLLGNGDGGFQPQVTYPVGSDPDSIVAGDFNGDGRLDLAVANGGSNNVSVLLGNGDGTFQPQVTYTVGDPSTAIVAGDFTGDGRLDLAVAGSDGVQILLGNGDGTFQPQVAYAVGIVPVAMVAGDFSGDGRLDLALAGTDFSSVPNSPTGEVLVLRGNSEGTFQPASQDVAGIHPLGYCGGGF